MNNLMRTTVSILVLGLLTLGVFTLRFACSGGDWQEVIRRSEELQRLDEATLRRQQAMRHATQAYIDQRYTLAQTMQRWHELEQELGQEWPVYSNILRQKLTSLSDEERHYGGIMAQVEAILRGQPEKLAAVLHRLEKDYQQLRAGRKMPSPMPMRRTELSR
jgi:hypothetical protein